MLPVIALVGRPNVGKSTLFNAFTRSRDALVADHEGLTRDRRYGLAELDEGALVVVDTGGLTGASSGIAGLTDRQVRAAIDEADLLLLVVDGRAGLTAEDERIAAQLRPTGKPVLVVVNKTDGLDPALAVVDFHGLGFDPVVAVAAAHRRGTTQLAELIVALTGDDRGAAPEPVADAADATATGPGDERRAADEGDEGEDRDEDDDRERGPPRLTVIGRPNVGKSTLVNRLLGEERVVAFDEPGTTRDAIEIPWEYEGQPFVLVDTAGVRRRGRVADTVEKFSVIKALQAIRASDVVIVLLDARSGVVDQDATILGHVLDASRPLVIAINKWDGLDDAARAEVRRELDRRLGFVPYAEHVFVSALHGSGLRELMAAVRAAFEASRQPLSTTRLTAILQRACEAHPPPMAQGRTAKLRYAHLGGNLPLRIVVHGNRVETVPESYRRYLMNTFRRELELVGTPLRLEFRQGDNPYAGRRNVLTRRQLAKRKRLKRFVKRRS